MDRKNMCAVVTGGAKGIGEAIVRRLMEDGVGTVVLADLDGEAAAAAAARIDPSGKVVHAYTCNVGSKEDVSQVFHRIAEEYGTISILVNNAGVTRDAMFHKMEQDQWDMVMDVNLNGIFHTCQAVIGPMRKQGYGKIVNLASVSAFGNVGQTNYGASKAAVIGFTKCLAKESARNNITVNAVAPSYVNTDMLRAVPEETMRRFIDAIPARRLAQPQEIASVVSFLCSDDSSFVNGECIVASGGSYM